MVKIYIILLTLIRAIDYFRLECKNLRLLFFYLLHFLILLALKHFVSREEIIYGLAFNTLPKRLMRFFWFCSYHIILEFLDLLLFALFKFLLSFEKFFKTSPLIHCWIQYFWLWWLSFWWFNNFRLESATHEYFILFMSRRLPLISPLIPFLRMLV